MAAGLFLCGIASQPQVMAVMISSEIPMIWEPHGNPIRTTQCFLWRILFLENPMKIMEPRPGRAWDQRPEHSWVQKNTNPFRLSNLFPAWDQLHPQVHQNGYATPHPVDTGWQAEDERAKKWLGDIHGPWWAFRYLFTGGESSWKQHVSTWRYMT